MSQGMVESLSFHKSIVRPSVSLWPNGVLNRCVSMPLLELFSAWRLLANFEVWNRLTIIRIVSAWPWYSIIYDGNRLIVRNSRFHFSLQSSIESSWVHADVLVGSWAWVAVPPDILGSGVLVSHLEGKTWLS